MTRQHTESSDNLRASRAVCVALAAAACATLLWAGTALATATPAQKCQAAKNKAAGKYALCRGNAEATLAKTGDTTKYDEAITKCETKYQTAWQKAEQKAVDAGSTCTTTGDQAAVEGVADEFTDNVAQHLGGAALEDCPGDLATCNTGLGTCNTNLGTCNSNLSSCNANLATVNAGTALAGNVLSGQTFSSGTGLGVTGTMPDNGAVTITPGTADQAIAAGYHNGSGKVLGDADLVPGNLVSGVNIFGVVGTQPPAQRLQTGQTQCDQGNGTLGACPGSPAGQDGSLQKGLARSYTVNANGTITDNKTGLIWEKLDDNNANGIHDYSATFTWYNAFKKIQVLNGDATGCIGANDPDACCTGAGTGSCSPFAGQTDWRLPNVNELQSLADYGRVDPSIDPAFNVSRAAGCTVASCSCTQWSVYWSSTTYRDLPFNAWLVHFGDGNVNVDDKNGLTYVRAVRGGS
jgi:hypothetical protein